MDSSPFLSLGSEPKLLGNLKFCRVSFAVDGNSRVWVWEELWDKIQVYLVQVCLFRQKGSFCLYSRKL